MKAVTTDKLTTKTKEECRWDCVSLGEVMRGSIRVMSGFTPRGSSGCEGGGEYNQRTAIVTALADNPVGRLVEDLMLQGGVDLSHLKWVKYDAVGRAVRNGLNFTERGYSVRAALGCSDRGQTAVSQLKPGEIDWEWILGTEGALVSHGRDFLRAVGNDSIGRARS